MEGELWAGGVNCHLVLMKGQQCGQGRKATRITGLKYVTILQGGSRALCYPEEMKGGILREQGLNNTHFMEDQWVLVSSALAELCHMNSMELEQSWSHLRAGAAWDTPRDTRESTKGTPRR